jgi:hypothetical protein
MTVQGLTFSQALQADRLRCAKYRAFLGWEYVELCSISSVALLWLLPGLGSHKLSHAPKGIINSF